MVGLMVVMMMMISQVQQTSSMVQLHRVSWLIEYFQISANIMELSNVHLCRDEDEDHDGDDHNEHDDDADDHDHDHDDHNEHDDDD